MKYALVITISMMILMGSGCRGDEVIQLRSPRTSQPTTGSTTRPLFPVETTAKLNKLLQDVPQEQLPGVVLYISTSNGTWMGAAGKANRDTEVNIQPEDRFRIGNLTMMFVAVACLQLVEEGQLNLDEPIATYLPSTISERLPNSDRIKLRRLLNHTSGLADVYTNEFWAAVQAEPTRQWTASEVLEYAYDLEPATVRGAFSYANTNYLLLEIILETVTNQPLAEVLRNRIQSPLELTHTAMEIQEPIPDGVIQGYQDWNGDGTLENVTQPSINGGLGLGDRGLVSNAPDLVKFLHKLFIDNQLLYSNTLDEMLEPIPSGKGDGYGMGMAYIVTRWGEAWGQMGQAIGFQSVVLYFPAHDLTLIVWTNVGDRKVVDPMQIAEDSLSIILGEPNFR